MDDLVKERDALKDSLLRLQADFLNYQRRASTDLLRAEELALRSYMNELLPILDSLSLLLKDAHSDTANLNTVRQAAEMIAASLNQLLSVRGLHRIECVGKPYDPTRHEAICPTESATNAICMTEIRAGYTWSGRVLRPAQVIVG